MRCPKCGFISFDHLDNCLKCNKEIKDFSDDLHGSVFKVPVPTFLKFEQQSSQEQPEAEGLEEMDISDGFDEEIRDPDLDILINEESNDEISFESDPGDLAIALDLDEEEVADEVEQEVTPVGEDELAFDLNDLPDFESELSIDDESQEEVDLGALEEGSDDEGGATLQIDLPEELGDISDLNQPATDAVSDGPTLTLDDGDLDLDLNLEESMDEGPIASLETEDDESLDLNLDDDLDLSDVFTDDDPAEQSLVSEKETTGQPEPKQPQPKQFNESVDLNEEINFDLDLGDLKFDDK